MHQVMYKHICNLLLYAELNIQNCIAHAYDGASVRIGIKNGVHNRIAEVAPWTVQYAY